jgi:tetratricopeptide (TPR) repeat protein
MRPDMPSRLDSHLDAFDAAWQQPVPPRLEDFLPPPSDPGRREVLVGLVRIDLERRLKRGEPVRLEGYLGRFPELRKGDGVLLDLVLLEHDLRQRQAAPVSAEEYLERFPELAAQLPTRLWTAPTPPEGHGVPALTALDLRGYELLDRVGRGGMGEVFRGKDPALGRDLAVKVLRPELRGNPEAEGRFALEARVTGSLQHPNIVPVHNLGLLPDGRLYFTMKLVRGRTLAEMLADGTGAGRLPELLGVFEKVCQAVAFAHSRGVIHRDLKPANVMVGAFGEVQVMDWGLAKVLAHGLENSGEGGNGEWSRQAAASTVDDRKTGVIGTPAYMPPEQDRGAAEEMDERADVFGLGAILCEILTGQPPYPGVGVDDVLHKAAGGDTSDALVRLQGCGADAELAALCRECLAVERLARPRDGGVVAEHVLAYQAGVQQRLKTAELERAAAEAREQQARATARAERKVRRRTGALAVAVVFLIAGGLAAFFLWQSVENQQQKNRDDHKGSGEINEKLALEELHAGRFGQAEKILAYAISQVQTEPTLEELRSRLAATMDRAHRLAQFYQLADEAERREALQTTWGDYYGDSGAVEASENGLAQLGVFEHEYWWDHLPEDDLQEQQKEALREDVYHQLLLLALIRVKQAFRFLNKEEERNAAFKSGLETLQAANRFHNDSYVGERLEYLGRYAIGQANQNPSFTAQEPKRASDHYFWGLTCLGVGIVFDPGQRRPWFEHTLVPIGIRLIAMDVQDPFEKAVFHFRSAATLRPEHYWTHCWLGLCLERAGRPDAAELAFNTCVALHPDYFTGYQFRARAILIQASRTTDPKAKGRLFERVLADYGKAIELQPKEAGNYARRADVYRLKGDFDRAIADYTQAILLNPKDALLYNMRGILHCSKRDYDRGLADFSDSIRLAPNNAQAYKNRGYVYFLTGNFDQAIADYTQALNVGQRKADLFSERACAYTAKGEAARAETDWEEVKKLDPKLGTSEGRSAALARHGLWAEAVATLRRFTEMEPNNPVGWHQLAIAHLGGGDLPAYRRVCAQMQERFGATREPFVASHLLYACLPGQETVEATDRLTQLADVAAPEWKGNVRLVGAVAYRRGQWQEAVRRFDEAEKVWSLRPWDWLFLAMAHHQLNHADKARQYFDRAVAWIDEADKPGAKEGTAGPSWGAWNEGVEVWALRREAEALLLDAARNNKK